jgi:hypothetical protein
MGIIDTTVSIVVVGGVGYLVYMYYQDDGICGGILGMTPACAGLGAIDFFKQQYNTGDAGVPFELSQCKEGWSNDGLICREPIGCCGDKDLFGNCYAWNLCGGRLEGRLDNQTCPSSHPDKVGLLCYKPCPAGWVHTEAMPYLCRNSEGGNFWDMTGGRMFDSWIDNVSGVFNIAGKIL